MLSDARPGWRARRCYRGMRVFSFMSGTGRPHNKMSDSQHFASETPVHNLPYRNVTHEFLAPKELQCSAFIAQPGACEFCSLTVQAVWWLTCMFHYREPVGSYLVSNSGYSKRHSVVCLSTVPVGRLYETIFLWPPHFFSYGFQQLKTTLNKPRGIQTVFLHGFD